MRALCSWLLIACGTTTVPPPTPSPKRDWTPPQAPAGSTGDPICDAVFRVALDGHQRFSNLVASHDPAYAKTSQAIGDEFLDGGPSLVALPGTTATEVTIGWIVGSFSATFADASAASFRRVRDAVERCPLVVGWTREAARDTEAIWYKDVLYASGPPRRLRLRVNRMLASDPRQLEPRADAMWLTIEVSPSPDSALTDR
jgi:hypothetical protein